MSQDLQHPTVIMEDDEELASPVAQPDPAIIPPASTVIMDDEEDST